MALTDSTNILRSSQLPTKARATAKANWSKISSGAAVSSSVVRKGKLEKLSRGNQRWQRRTFVLEKDGKLRYFGNQAGQNVLDFSKCTSVSKEGNSVVLHLRSADDITLKAKTEAKAAAWVTDIAPLVVKASMSSAVRKS